MTQRALRLLAAFDTDHVALTLSALARRADLPVATCHRLVGELVAWGALTKVDGRYRIGHRIWYLGLLAPVHRDLSEIANPFMQDVLQVTKNVVNLFVLDGDQALLLERISSTQVGPAVLRVGDHVGPHATAGGKVLLAHARPDVVDRALRAPHRYTRNTLVGAESLRRELVLVRRHGYATTVEEVAPGTSGLAIPVAGHDGTVFAALGVVIVGNRVNPRPLVPVLQIAARGIARQVRLAAGYGHESLAE
ncbi:DNA-binding IclR family transcriptional regulator [Lipingzhangella halophila]|uniref:DNA-binding IclR family transcriptional regulator n=1 Tax=Lipingzhangella halophila TaxID=1783352 RepID=A0A7W7W4K5_9ACTN|nr:DNA-binding IclR family transcriptional regulator [Lipingzhangella halophila]